MHVDTPHIVNHIANLYRVRLILKFELVRFSHGLSGIRCLSPNQWEADTLPSGNADYVRQPDTIIIRYFLMIVKFIFLTQTQYPSTSRKLKHGDLTAEGKSDCQRYTEKHHADT